MQNTYLVHQVMGSVRVPLYTMDNMYNGLPAFLNNKFAGTSKQQLLLALHHSKLLTEQEISDVILKSQNLKLAPNRFWCIIVLCLCLLEDNYK